jgi:mRNA interferase MazF
LVTAKTAYQADKSYVPDRGDIVWLNFSPQSGHEQRGFRPAFVLSPKNYNKLVGLALFCPITNKVKAYPFEVLLARQQEISGVILCDQIKSLDWRMRKAKFIVRVRAEIIEEAMAKSRTLLEP